MKSKKQPKQTIEQKIKEYNRLVVLNPNCNKAKELKKEIDNFNYGII